MRKITGYSVLLAIMIISSLWLHSFPHAFALTTYGPGLKAGDSITYGDFSVNNTTPYPYFQGNISTVTVQVNSVVSSTNTVLASLTTAYRNGSQTTNSLNGTTDTQRGNLLPYIVAGGLSAGDLLWKTPYNGLAVNETVDKVYAGALRSVNLVNITYQSYYQSVRFSYAWDMKSGFLLEANENDNYTYQSGQVVLQIHFRATATNIWTPDSTPDFSMDASGQTNGLHLGETTSYRLDLASLNRFNGSISLTASLLGAAPPQPPSIALSSALVSVSAQNPVSTSILALATNSSTTLGDYLVGINATSGTTLHRLLIAVDIAPPDYAISASPSNLTLAQGVSRTSTITVKSLGAFTGTVGLQAFPQFFNSPVTALLSTSSVTLNSTKPIGISILTVSAPATAPPGTGGVNIDGVSGNIYRSTFVAVNVTGPDFRLTAAPTSLTFKEGQSGTSLITLTSILGFSGVVSLSASTYGPVSAHFSPNNLTLTAGGKASTNVTLSTPASGPPGIYSVYLYGTNGNIQHSAYVNLNVTGPDFRFTANIYSVTLQAGQMANATLTISQVGGFSGTIVLSTSTYGSISASVNPIVESLNSTRLSSTALLSVSVPIGAVPGFYSVSINAASGNIVHSVYFGVQVIGPDFTISANPGFLSIPQGGTTQSTILLSSLDNFTGSVQVYANNYFPPSLAVSLSPGVLSLSPGGVANSTLTVQVPTTTAPGYYFVNVIASSGQLTHSIGVEVQVTGPDFTVLSSPSFLTISQGHSANSTITLTSIDNFDKAVNVTAFTYYPTRVSVSPKTTILTPSRNASLTTTLMFSTSSNTPPGAYYFQIVAVGGNLTRYSYVQLDVTGPDFSILLNPYSLTLTPGSSAASTVTLTSILGFTGNVTLSASSFGVNGTLTKPFVQLGSNGTASLALTVHVPVSLQSGYYSVLVNATSGFITRLGYLFVQVVAPDFTVAFSQNSLTVSNGQSAQSLLTLKSLNGFNGTVSISPIGFLPSGLTVTLNASSVRLAPGASAVVTLNVTASNAAINQAFYLSVQATSGNLTRFAYIYLNVVSPSFTIAPNPQFLTTPRGTTIVSLLTINSVDGFSGRISLNASAFAGISISIVPQNITLTSNSSASVTVTIVVSSSTLPGNYGISIRGTNGTLVVGSFIQVQVTGTSFMMSSFPSFIQTSAGGTVSSTVQANAINGFKGPLVFSASSSPVGLNATFSPQILTFNSTATVASSTVTITTPSVSVGGFYTLTVTGSGEGVNQTVIISVFVTSFDFRLLAQPMSLTVFQGGSNSSSINVDSLSGFTGQVSLNTQVFPLKQGVSASLTTSNLFVSGNHTSISTLTVSTNSTTPLGLYDVQVNGFGISQANTGITHSITVSVTVLPKPDFAITATPVSLSLVQGSSTQGLIELTSLNSFNGTVSVNSSVSLQGLAVATNASSIFLVNGGTVNLAMNVSAGTNVVGYFTITVTAQSGGIVHSTVIQVYVAGRPDFTLYNPPSFVYVQAGDSASFAVTLLSLNGFVGRVQVSSSVSASGVSFTPNPLNVSLSSSEMKSAFVRVTATLTTSPGTYVLTLSGNATTGAHSTSLDLIVLPPPDFTLSANAAFLTIQAGSSASVIVTLRSLDGFVGGVQVSSAANSTGVSSTPSFSTVSLSKGGTADATFSLGTSVSTSPGIYSITFSGNATAGVSVGVHSWTVLVQVLPPPDFTMKVYTQGLIIASGASMTTTVSILPLNGFTSPVALSATAAAGITGTFSPNPVPGGIPGSYLNLTVASTVASGNYNVTVTGTGGSFTHQVSFPVIVSGSSKVSLTETQVSYAHKVSLSKNGGTETWTFTVKNTGKTPTYIQALTAGNSTSPGLFFTSKTSATLVAAGASVTFTISQPFTSSNIGSKYNFTVNLLYGSGLDVLGQIINPTNTLVTKGSFTIVT